MNTLITLAAGSDDLTGWDVASLAVSALFCLGFLWLMTRD